jgi:hypothetical protein
MICSHALYIIDHYRYTTEYTACISMQENWGGGRTEAEAEAAFLENNNLQA